MVYNVQITDNSIQAHSIVNMLKTISADYDFIKIHAVERSEDEINSVNLLPEIEAEIDSRMEYVMQNENEGKTWDEVEQRLLSVCK